MDEEEYEDILEAFIEDLEVESNIKKMKRGGKKMGLINSLRNLKNRIRIPMPSRISTWWATRAPHVRWWRTGFYTAVAFTSYVFSIYFFFWLEESYSPSIINEWIRDGWNWFFWPALIAFWLEELIDAGQPAENRWNPWPKKLFGAYIGIVGGSILMAFLALVTNHDFYINELRGKTPEATQERRIKLERELAEVEGKAPPKGEFEKNDDFVSDDDFVGDKFEEGGIENKRSTWRIKFELWKAKLEEMVWKKTVGEDVSALYLRFSKAVGWLYYAALWLPSLVFFLVIVFFAYGLDVLESRTVQLFGWGKKLKK